MSARGEHSNGRRRAAESEAGTADALGGVARVAAGVWLRSASWGVGTSVRVARAAVDPRAATELAQDLVEALRGYARELLGLSDMSLDRRIKPPLSRPARPTIATALPPTRRRSAARAPSYSGSRPT
jgi:hypothetical protein